MLTLYGLGIVALLLFSLGLRPNFGRLLGTREKWYDWPNQVYVHGSAYNGLITYYVFFVPVWKRGFNHSTTFIGD